MSMALNVTQSTFWRRSIVAKFGNLLSADNNGLKKSQSQKINLILKEDLVKIYFRMEA